MASAEPILSPAEAERRAAATADTTAGPDAQADAQGALVTAASDALYRAFKISEEDTPCSGDSEYRVHFFDAFRTVTVAVAAAEGTLTPDASTAIDQIFWLDRTDLADVVRANVATPDQVETAIQKLCAMAVDASRFAAIYDKPHDAGANPLVLAAAAVFDAMLAIGPFSNTAHDLATSIVTRMVTPLPAAARSDRAEQAQPAPLPDTSDDQPTTVEQPGPALIPIACPARLHDGEACYAVTDATLYQERNVTRRVRYAGMSARVRIARGISFGTGTYDVDRIATPEMQQVAEGVLCITNQRLIFLSAIRNLDLPFARQLACDTDVGTILVARPNGGSLLFSGVGEDAVAVFEQFSGASPDNRLRAVAAAADSQAAADREEEVADDAPDPVSSGAGVTLAVVVAIAAVVALIVYLHHR